MDGTPTTLPEALVALRSAQRARRESARAVTGERRARERAEAEASRLRRENEGLCEAIAQLRGALARGKQ